MARSRFRVKMYGPFVQKQIAARDAGGDLTWAHFSAAHRPTWRERHRDFVEDWYRSPALWHGEGKPLRALGYRALAALTEPGYTLRPP